MNLQTFLDKKQKYAI